MKIITIFVGSRPCSLTHHSCCWIRCRALHSRRWNAQQFTSSHRARRPQRQHSQVRLYACSASVLMRGEQRHWRDLDRHSAMEDFAPQREGRDLGRLVVEHEWHSSAKLRSRRHLQVRPCDTCPCSLSDTNWSSVTSTTVAMKCSITCLCRRSSCAPIPITSATSSTCRCSTITWSTRLSRRRGATTSSPITVRGQWSGLSTWLTHRTGQIVVSIKMYTKEYFNQANTVQEVKALRAETTDSPKKKKKKNKSPHYVVKSPQTPAAKK